MIIDVVFFRYDKKYIKKIIKLNTSVAYVMLYIGDEVSLFAARARYFFTYAFILDFHVFISAFQWLFRVLVVLFSYYCGLRLHTCFYM